MTSQMKECIVEKYDWLSYYKTYEDIIYKQLVVGYVVIETTYSYVADGVRHVIRSVTQRPILSSMQGENEATESEMSEGISLEDGMKVIGILPAPFPTYQVSGFDIDGCGITLGYEHPGLPPINWVEKLREHWRVQQEEVDRKVKKQSKNGV